MLGGFTGSDSMVEQRQVYTASHYSRHRLLQCTGYCNESANRCQLEADANNVAGGGSAVSGTEINWNSATKVIKRTSAFTATDGYDYCCYYLSGGASQALMNPFLVIAFVGGYHKLYLNSAAAGYTPSTRVGTWNDTSPLVTKKCSTVKDASGNPASAGDQVGDGTSGHTYLEGLFVSDPWRRIYSSPPG